MNTADIKHYVKILKQHEANRTSTNERNKYWREYGSNTTS